MLVLPHQEGSWRICAREKIRKKRGILLFLIFRTLFNTTSSTAPQVSLCRRMPGSNTGQLRRCFASTLPEQLFEIKNEDAIKQS